MTVELGPQQHHPGFTDCSIAAVTQDLAQAGHGQHTDQRRDHGQKVGTDHPTDAAPSQNPRMQRQYTGQPAGKEHHRSHEQGPGI